MSVWGLAYSIMPIIDLQLYNVDCTFAMLFGAVAMVYLMAGATRGGKTRTLGWIETALANFVASSFVWLFDPASVISGYGSNRSNSTWRYYRGSYHCVIRNRLPCLE